MTLHEDLATPAADVTDAEWRTRVDLAALYRLVALQGWDDLIFTHISARIPGPEDHFLINPYGLFFEEITASSLVKVGLDGKEIGDSGYPTNPAGFTIHSAVHAARHDVNFVIHLHTDAGVAVSAQADGLLPLTQHGLIALPGLAYHDYEGIALNHEERARLVADLGDSTTMLLRNHGTLAVGSTAAECWLQIHNLERACAQQVMALTAGFDRVLRAPEAARKEVESQVCGPIRKIATPVWPACLRKLDRHLPGYAD